MEKIIDLNIKDLVPGMILKENIPNFTEVLKEGVVLDSIKIEMLKAVGRDFVAVLEIEDEGKLRAEKSKALGKEISDRIDGLFGRDKGALKQDQPDVSDSEIESANEEKDAILRHVKQSQDDIQQIESITQTSIKEINRSIEDAIHALEKEIKRVLVEKTVSSSLLNGIVSSLIDLTGPKREASFLLIGIIRKGAHLVVKHAVNTCLLSLAIAIELSKIMDEQLKRPEVAGDFKKLKICNAKIFSREELIKLGVAGVLHDVGLVDVFPDISEMTILSSKDFSKVQLHPSRTFSFLSMTNVEFDIRKAVLQHHERCDGSGYPDGIEKRMMTKYSLVLSFANHYDLKTTRNPFEKYLHPQKALLEILQHERSKFDDDVIFAFCKVASLYPVGSWLMLSDGSIGLVVRSNRNDLKKPIVKVTYTPGLKESKVIKFVDLTKSDLTVKEIIDVESIEIFDPRYERFIFDEREFHRMTAEMPVHISIRDTEINADGTVENISAGGLQFRSSLKMEHGYRIYLDFEFQGRSFKAYSGLIAWKKEIGPNMFSYGLRFLSMTDEEHIFFINTIHSAEGA